MALSLFDIRPASEGTCPYDSSPLITRADDRPDAVEARLSGYETYEREVVAFYSSRDYYRVDGQGSMQDVTARVLDALTQALAQAA